MKSQDTTTTSTLTYTLGNSDTGQLTRYFDVLCEIVPLFTVEVEQLLRNEDFSSCRWAKDRFFYPTSFRAMIYFNLFHSSEALDAPPEPDHKPSFYDLPKIREKPTIRQRKAFSFTLNCCLNLADDLIISEAIIDQYQNMIAQLETLQQQLNDLSAKFKHLQDKAGKHFPQSLDQSYLRLLNQHSNNITNYTKQYQHDSQAVTDYRNMLWSFAVKQHDNIDQIWDIIFQQYSTRYNTSSTTVEQFRSQIYHSRIQLNETYYFLGRHHSVPTRQHGGHQKTDRYYSIGFQQKDLLGNQTSIHLEDFIEKISRNYKEYLTFIGREKINQANFTPVINDLITLVNNIVTAKSDN